MDTTQATYGQKIEPIITEKLFNPFPGLRPFGIEESHLFFGREGQSDEVLDKLARNRFCAVIGASGSGKSSLMYCGLTPILHGGFLTETGSKWKIIVTRPGGGPILNLAESLVKADKSQDKNDEERYFKQAITASVLRSSSLGLVDAIKQLQFSNEENILLMVDQFEELFRFKSLKGGTQALNESLAFVRLLLEAVRQNQLPVYIVLTMRSDFIGECAQFQELTTLINESHYLIPQMTREDFQKAIIGPVAVGGGKITPRLVHQLLNDVGDNPDQLPILQHALMRTWDYWTSHKKENEPLDIVDYEAIGRMEKALSLHANEAYDELTEDNKYVCDKIFKSLTEIGLDNRGIRHPSSVKELCDIADAPLEQVKTVLDKFRIKGRSFLNPSIDFELTESTIIDISHESLMRIWDRLILWVEEEAAAIKMYLRLHEAAENYQKGEGGLWTPPDLHLASAWKIKQKPTLAWALRHAPAFERTMVFLETSEKNYQAEEENKIKLQKRSLRRSRITALILGVAAILSLLFMLYALNAQVEAKKSEAKAKIERINADKQKIISDLTALIAEFEGEKAIENEKKANIQRIKAIRQTLISQLNAQIASIESMNAKQQRQIANTQKNQAQQSAKEARDQRKIAYIERQRADTLRMLSISQSMAVKSQQITRDTTLKGLVALQAYNFNKKFNGNPHNPDLYAALYFSDKYLNSENKDNMFTSHATTVKSLAFSPNGSAFYSVGGDKKMIRWMTGENNKVDTFKNQSGNIITCLSVSPNGDYIANGTQNNMIQIYNAEGNTNSPLKIIKNPTGSIRSLHFGKENHFLYSLDSKNNIKIWNLQEDNPNPMFIVFDKGKILEFDVSVDGEFLAAAYANGNVKIWELNEKNIENNYKQLADSLSLTLKKEPGNIDVAVTAICFDRKTEYLAYGDINGFVHVYEFKNDEILTLSGQTARISDLSFSPDNSLLASASFDASILVSETQNLNNQPIILKDKNSWVWSISFSKDGNHLIAGYQDGTIQKWPTKTEKLAQHIKPELNRNMSLKEWDRFVAEDIPPEKIVDKDWDDDVKQRIDKLNSNNKQ